MATNVAAPSVCIRMEEPSSDNLPPSGMTWTTIRLELARTREFPEGSPDRHYLVRLPLGAEGLIDSEQLQENPQQARVHRVWPDEPNTAGYVIPTPHGWALSYKRGEDDDETVYHLETHPLRPGEYLTLTEPDGLRLPFRVTSVVAD